MSDHEPKWLIGNERRTRRRYLEPVHILWMSGFGLSALVLFFIPATQALWLWTVPATFFVIGSWPTRHGPGFLAIWDKIEHANRRKEPELGDTTVEKSTDGKEADGTDKRGRRIKHRPPIRVRSMEYFHSISKRRTGVLYSPQRIADGAIIASTGFDGALLDTEEFYLRTNALSDALLDAARGSLEPIGMVSGWISRPLDITRGREWQMENVHKKTLASVPGTMWREVATGKPIDAVLADAQKVAQGTLERELTADEFLHQEMVERDALKQQYAHDSYSFYGLTVPRPKEWPLGNQGVIHGLLEPEQLNQAPIVQLTEIVEQGLIANGALGVFTFDLDALHDHLRRAWDMNPNTLRAWQEGGTRTADGKPFNPTNPWPPYDFYSGVCSKGLPYIDYGGTLHRIYVIAGLEHKLIRPRQLRELFQPGYLGPANEVGYGAALVGETVLSSDEVRAATRSIRLKKAFRRWAGKDTGEFDESAREREEALLQENERDAFDYGGSHGLMFNFYIDLAVYNKDKKAAVRRLEEVDERFRLVARNMRVHTTPIRLAPHMNRALWSMYGATGLL